VALLKATTIPRLELNGALLLAELVSEVKSELRLINIIIPDSEIYLWSDSTIVLAWIKSKCIFQVYVSNRIAGIQDLTSPEQWSHVPTDVNRLTKLRVDSFDLSIFLVLNQCMGRLIFRTVDDHLLIIVLTEPGSG